MTFSAFALVITPAGLSSRSMSVTTRPNEAALVTSLSSIVQTYGWWVWALTTTFTRSSRPLAIEVISGPLKFTHLLTSMNASGWFAGPGNTGAGIVCDPPWWSSTTNALILSFAASVCTSALTVWTSGLNSRPATAEGVTIVGVPSSVSPMNAIFFPSIVLISYGGRIVSFVPM